MQTGILFLQKDKFQIYSPLLPNILEFRFVPELIKDFDLVNRELLENLLKVFIVNNKLPAGNFIIVIADNAAFIKDFISAQPAVPQTPGVAAPNLEELRLAANSYLDYVPFEVVSSHIFSIPNGVRAFATNQDIFEGIKIVLEKLGFIIEGVFPGFIFDPAIGNMSTMDGKAITAILEKLPTLREYNLFKEASTLPETAATNEVEEKEEKPTKQSNKRVYVLVGVFVFLIIIIILIIVIIMNMQPAKPVVNQPILAPQTTSSQIISPTTAQISVSPVFDYKDLTVQIINASNSAVTADALKIKLASYGFRSIEVEPQTAFGASQNLLIFSSKVNAQAKNTIAADVKNILGNVLIQEKADLAVDVQIVVWK